MHEDAVGPDRTDDQAGRDAALLASVQAIAGSACSGCGARLCGHEAVLSIVLGYRNRPRCANCLGRELGEARATLCERSLQWVLRRDCFLRGWLWASAREDLPGEPRPPCLFPAPLAGSAAPVSDAATMTEPRADDRWDAGQMGCGDLVLELRLRLQGLRPGAVLQVRAEDPGAPLDLPAWCGLTGHALLHSRHPDYWIRRKETQP
jgi:tRNA 2-thiouridine synthesizing protein A